MKILLSNKFYYRRGGDCVCTINLENLLKSHGHSVAIFAMEHPETISTQWKKYFPSEVKFEFSSKIIEAITRPFGSKEVRHKFLDLLDDFQPDIVHLNNIHSQLSPIIAQIAHKKNIKVVWTLHDYKLLCPRYDCRKKGKEMCNECFSDKKNVIKNRCMKDSIIASYLSYLEALKWNKDKLEAYTDYFICPSNFMREKMIEGGFNPQKLIVLCNFIDTEKCKCNSYEKKEDYYCYIGRLSSEKGVQTLIEAANRLPYRLKIIGNGPLDKDLQKKAKNQIEFLGFKQWEEIKQLVNKAKFNILPSECYENNPLSIIESLCLGTPVLGANIGGIPELIEEKINGMVFESKNSIDLENKIRIMWNHPFNYFQIAQQAQNKYNAENYYKNILEIYKR